MYLPHLMALVCVRPSLRGYGCAPGGTPQTALMESSGIKDCLSWGQCSVHVTTGVADCRPPLKSFMSDSNHEREADAAFKGRPALYDFILSQTWHMCHRFVLPDMAQKCISRALSNLFWSNKKDLVIAVSLNSKVVSALPT